MTTPALDQGPSRHGTTASSVLPPEQPTTPAGPVVDHDAVPGPSDDAATGLATWWAGLPAGRQRQLLGLVSGEPLPRALVADLREQGVPCPLVLVRDGARVVRRSVAPQALLDLLARERAAAGAVVVID